MVFDPGLRPAVRRRIDVAQSRGGRANEHDLPRKDRSRDAAQQGIRKAYGNEGSSRIKIDRQPHSGVGRHMQ